MQEYLEEYVGSNTRRAILYQVRDPKGTAYWLFWYFVWGLDTICSTISMFWTGTYLQEYVKGISATGMQSNHGFEGQINACWTHKMTRKEIELIRSAGFLVSVIHGRCGHTYYAVHLRCPLFFHVLCQDKTVSGLEFVCLQKVTASYVHFRLSKQIISENQVFVWNLSFFINSSLHILLATILTFIKLIGMTSLLKYIMRGDWQRSCILLLEW